MLDRYEAIDLLTTKYRGSRVDKSHAMIFTFHDGKQVAAEHSSSENQRLTFSLVVNALPPKDVLLLDLPVFYPRGKKDGRNSNITKKDAPALWRKDHDTWRIYPKTRDELDVFLSWYLDAEKPVAGSDELLVPRKKSTMTSVQLGIDKGPGGGADGSSPATSRSMGSLEDDKSRSFTPEETASARLAADNIDALLAGFDGEDQDVLAKRRINQGKFRTCLLRYWNGRCCITDVADARLLVASHILPWSKATRSARGDPANGLLLSVLWDALFDRGLISFRDDGNAILDRLDEALLSELGIDRVKAQIRSGKLTKGHRDYLKQHRLLYGFEPEARKEKR